ncbi:MAG: OmpA family protein [Candidatus Nitronauta litoralis]|uniref:OmpA family protein n=1 Tax=Candidatus Nitronauta litoralis TaxID=2705533 RepID=A0A7T0BXW3_9BACT|nr:MAG: OmpA family protein [Candidatus Nitronauta litoralis]
MKETQENQQLKEQVRIKNTELNRVRVEKIKQEEKVQFLQEFTQKRIKSLQAKIEEQEEEIRYFQKRGLEISKNRKDPNSDNHLEAEESAEDSINQKERYLKTLQYLKEIKAKNDQLGLKLEHEKKERDRLTKEKGILAREIKRIRDEPRSTSINPGLSENARIIEERMEKAQVRYEQLLKEKDELISSYEEAIHAATNSGEASPTAIKILAENLEELRKEKVMLESSLERERKLQKTKLQRQLAQLEIEITQQLKRKLNRKKKSKDSLLESIEDGSTDGWITTYADLATLLMTFFILYYSLGQMDIEKIRDVVEEGGPPEKLQSIIKAKDNPESLEMAMGLIPNQIEKDMQSLSKQLENQVEIESPPGENKIILKLPGETLFSSGSADLELKKSREILEEIVKVAKKYSGYKIQINGHTDDVPIDSEKFPTNWELSAARAAAVLRFFLDKNIPAERVSASGYADTFPVADNDSAPGRKINRRVEIVLEKEG